MRKQVAITGSDVRRARRGAGLTQAEFAKKIGVSTVTVARWETNQRKCTSDSASRVMAIECEQKRPSLLKVQTVFSVRENDLAALTSHEAVEVFRDLLWCQARRLAVPVTHVQLT